MYERDASEPLSRAGLDASLAERIDYWQTQFNELAPEDITVGLIEEAQDDLDEHCWYNGQSCLFSGIGRVAGGFFGSGARADFIDNKIGDSIGMVITKFSESDVLPWIVAHAFELTTSADFIEDTSTALFVEASQAQVVPLEEIEEVFDDINLPHEVLNMLSDELASALVNPEFWNLTADEQRYYMVSSLQTAREQVTGWMDINEKPLIVEAEYAYVKDISQPALAYEMKVVMGHPVGGNCLGLDVLALHKMTWPNKLTQPEQLINASGGLYLVVMPDRQTAVKYNLSPDQPMYFPVSGQAMGFYFLESRETADSDQ